MLKILFLILLILLNLSVYGLSVFYPPATIQIINTTQHEKPEWSAYKIPDYKSFDFMLTSYTRTREANAALNGAAAFAGEFAHIVIDTASIGGLGASVLTGNFPGLIATKMGRQMAHDSVNYAISSFEAQGEHLAKQNLLGAIKDTYKRVPNLGSLTPKQQYLELEKTQRQQGQLIEKVINNKEDNAILQTFMIDSVSSQIVQLGIKSQHNQEINEQFQKQLLVENLEMKSLSEEQQAESINEIKKLGRAVIQIEAKRLANQNAVLENQKKMLTSISDLTNEGGMLYNVNSNVLAVKEMMFSKLTPKEQQARIDDGSFDDIFKDGKQKIAFKTTIDFQVATTELFQTANSVAQIAGNIGINSKFVGNVTKGIAVGQSTANLALSYMKGDAMGMLNSVASLTGFFGKQTDPASERHNQIMESFKQISEQIRAGNEAILTELGVIKTALKTIDDNIKIIDKKTTIIINQLDEINARLYNVDHNVVGLGYLMIDNMYRDYLNCANKFITPIKEAKNSDELLSIIKPYKQSYSISERMKECLRGFDLIFSRNEQSDFFKTFATFEGSRSATAKANYRRIFELLGDDIYNISLSKLISPNSEYWALDSKKDLSDIRRVGFDWEQMSNPVDTNRVLKAVDDYLVFYPITYMFSQDCKSGYCELLQNFNNENI